MPKHSFKGGVHPLHDQHEGKTSTSGLPIREYIPDSVDIPMSMSIGAPAAPCVKVGDHVKLGQKIADATGFVSLPVHASVSGEVTAIGTKVLLLGGPTTIITIRNDFQDEWTELEPLGGVEECDPAKIVPAVQAAGICGMGGATFPTHVKLTVGEVLRYHYPQRRGVRNPRYLRPPPHDRGIRAHSGRTQGRDAGSRRKAGRYRYRG